MHSSCRLRPQFAYTLLAWAVVQLVLLRAGGATASVRISPSTPTPTPSNAGSDGADDADALIGFTPRPTQGPGQVPELALFAGGGRFDAAAVLARRQASSLPVCGYESGDAGKWRPVNSQAGYTQPQLHSPAPGSTDCIGPAPQAELVMVAD